MRIRIETEQCTGHGRCYVTAPELFVDDEVGDGHVRPEFTSADVPGALIDTARRASNGCPERAIVLDEP